MVAGRKEENSCTELDTSHAVISPPPVLDLQDVHKVQNGSINMLDGAVIEYSVRHLDISVVWIWVRFMWAETCKHRFLNKPKTEPKYFTI